MSRTATAHTAPKPLTHREIMVILGALMTGTLLASLDQTIVATALPTVVGELGGIEHLSWVVTAYLLASTASTPLYGKISDLYGRRPVYLFSIITFLVGSLLSGLAQEMWQLIAARAVQGLGGGGLMSLAFTIIGDVIPPRERGRYQGYFGAVFAVSSIVGPLLGGFFVDQLSWRWIFFINLPVGLFALAVTWAKLHLHTVRREHQVDYLGAGLLVLGVSSLLLALVRGGDLGWTSAGILMLLAGAVVITGVFLWWETRVSEPILPLRLFGNRTVRIGGAIGFVIGAGMFGAVVFLPIYFQVVRGVSPTASGLMLTPLMAGMLVASIGSGRLISRMGRYKVFPVLGTALVTLAMWLLSTVSVTMPYAVLAGFLVLLGVGMGCTMQVVVLAVQNAVDFRDMGVATSTSTFLRSMGGTVGTAVFGSILTAQLSSGLAARVPAGALHGIDPGAVTGSPAVIHALPAAVRQPVVEAFVHALDVVFLAAVPLAALAFLLTLRLPEHRLRGHDDMHGPVAGGGAAADESADREPVGPERAERDCADEVGEADTAELPELMLTSPGMGEAIEEEIEHGELR